MGFYSDHSEYFKESFDIWSEGRKNDIYEVYIHSKSLKWLKFIVKTLIYVVKI